MRETRAGEKSAAYAAFSLAPNRRFFEKVTLLEIPSGLLQGFFIL
jgi:hypothetical protein